ncbi:MFS transporter [Duganella lactea]|uniref:MFS transporter n=1 Tax=Duganella lactea TaxID=2692173 RepID=UPI001927BD6A|nr:MFS transporter [Duganella lactea]
MKISRHCFIIVAVIGLALNLRPAMAAIGPLLDMIEAATGLSHTQSSLLTSLPVFVMGLCALGGRHIAGKFSERNGIALGMALVCAACLARYCAGSSAGLLLTAILAGAGIALVQTLLPAFIKRRFGAEAGSVFGLYTTGIMGGAAIAAASAAGLAAQSGWQFALAVWALPALGAFFLWRRATAGLAVPLPAVAAGRTAQPGFWRNQRAWELMIFFGIGTGAYTLVLAWLPPFYTSLGWKPAEAGFLLGGLALAEVVAGLAVSAWIGRFPDRRLPLLAVLLLLSGGLLCLIFAPLSLALPACLMLGIGIGALFPLSLILTLDHLDDPAQAGMLTAFVQGGGYIIASCMPLLAGVLRDRFSDLTQAWVAMLIGALCLVALCLRFSPTSYRRIACTMD